MMIAHSINTVSVINQENAWEYFKNAIYNKVHFSELRKLHTQYHIDLSGDFGLHMLNIALLSGADDKILLLLEVLGVNPRSCYSDGTPFVARVIQDGRHREIRANTLHGLQYLTAAGVDINQQDTLGNTPLHLLLCKFPTYNFSDYVPELIEEGADINKPNNKGRTPSEMTLNHRFASNIFTHPKYKVKWKIEKGELVVCKNNFRNADIYRICKYQNKDFLISLLPRLEKDLHDRDYERKQAKKSIKTNVTVMKKSTFKV